MLKVTSTLSTTRHLTFVPKYSPVSESDITRLKDFFTQHTSNILVLTGAGISTESGIPDYRSKDVGLYARKGHKPITYQQFVDHPNIRKRYWARSFVAWSRFSSAIPSFTHLALRKLESEGVLSCIVTQNVDNLHFEAKSEKVIELHGTLFRVKCVTCGHYQIDRATFQKLLKQINPSVQITSQVLRPDGDVELPEECIASFNILNCPQCDGILKPDVVFFGENVPIARVNKIKEKVDSCESMLVLGSSLTVFSAFRIILQAAELRKPICIVNIGPTRADQYASLKIDTNCGDILKEVLPIIS